MGGTAPFTDEGLQNLPPDARCLHCGYTLRCLTTPRCPECGHAFDPGDPSTYQTRGGTPALLRGFQGPPRIWHTALTIVLTAYCVVGQSDPRGPAGLFPPASCCLDYVALPLVLLNYGIRAMLTFGAPREEVADKVGRRRWAWVIPPVCAGLCVWVLVQNWPLQWRFRASQAAFQAEVVRLAALPPHNPEAPQYDLVGSKKWLGLYRVHHALIRRDPNGVAQRIDFCTGGFLFGAWGFEYDCTAPTVVAEPQLPPGWSRWVHMK